MTGNLSILESRGIGDASIGRLSGSMWRRAGYRFCRNRAAMAGVVTLVLIALASVLVPILSIHDLEDASWEFILSPPSFENGHWFGTDANGRDLLVRVFFAGRVSLTIGLLTTLVALTIGVSYGAVAGFAGGRTDGFMMRLVDILYS